jgi:hypothetical protein
MAKPFQNYIDQFLEDYTPDYAEVGLAGAAESGKEQLDRTHDYVDEDFLEGLSDGTSVHTQLPAGGRGTKRTGSQQAQDRQDEKEAAFPRVRASQVINRTARALSDESCFSDVVMKLEEAKNHGFSEKREVSEAEVQRYVRRLLNDGMPPVKVAMKIKAELELFQHNMATDYLNRNAGLLGLAYIQPNEYMDRCPDTYERLNVKAAGGKIMAKAVKQIHACEGCMFFGKDASAKTCNLYHLPIVGTQKELLTVVNKMTAGVPAGSKKAALVKIANREPERTPMVKTIVSSRPEQKPYHTSPEQARQQTKKASFQLTAGHIEKLFVAGNTLEKIYNVAANKVGSVAAGKAVREFVAGLKTKNTKIALSQVDCTFLKAKLGVQNAIVGAPKCASCSYRQGMHCGLTGGTLVSYPGMEHQASNHKIASGAPQDGRAMLQEYDLTASAEPQDIEINAAGPARAEVQMGSAMTAGDIE